MNNTLNKMVAKIIYKYISAQSFYFYWEKNMNITSNEMVTKYISICTYLYIYIYKYIWIYISQKVPPKSCRYGHRLQLLQNAEFSPIHIYGYTLIFICIYNYIYAILLHNCWGLTLGQCPHTHRWVMFYILNIE